MKKKLLLADDSVTIQKVVQITFSSDDYDLTVVDNGDIAYEKARSQRPDLILADVFMPGKNGYELCAAVKNDPSLATVPVLLLTGTFEPFDEAKARSVGADRWIAKPFESQTLIACVEELLTQAATQAPTIAPPAFIPISAPVPEPVAVDEFATPDLSSDLPDDLWGSEFDAEGASGSDDLPAADAFAATSQDDLWDVSGFETETPGAAADADDLWGSFEATPAVAAPLAPAEEAVTLADDSWESDDFSTAFASEPSAAVAPFAADAAEVPLADDFEILEEIDLLEPAADSSPDISLADTFSPDDFSFDEEPVQPEVEEEAPSVLVASVPVPPPVTPPPLSVADVVPPETAIPSDTDVATSGAALSDAQMDLIVERVADVVITRLTGTLLEKIAWEVVPDLAETMIKEELRKIREAVAAG
jgi:CheY-like chemotaxis protein